MLVARRAELLETLAAELGGEAEVCDVSDRAAVEATAAAVLDRHPAIRLLVNNAGVGARVGFLDAEPERIEAVLRTNYLGAVWCLRAFLPGLERARPAHVVNVVSVAGTFAYPQSGPYCASKHAQLAFSRASAAELAGRGIRVHTVNPGFVHTEGFPNRGRLGPLDRLVIDPEDVARAIVAALDRGRVEAFVPEWYRLAAAAQAVLPGTLARLLGHPRSRRIGSGSE